MPDLLLEIFSEEIPARMQKNAANTFGDSVKKIIDSKFNISCKVLAFSTPRRIGLNITDIPSEIKVVKETVRGPRISAPEAALLGFCKKNSIDKNDVFEEGEYYFAEVSQGDGEVKDVLSDILQSELEKFVWPKSMKWADNDTRWVRPIHNILCIYNNAVIPIEFTGKMANNKTHGHRFLAPNEIEVKDFNDYKTKLANACVVLDREERKSQILSQINVSLEGKNLKLIEDASLLEEVTGLIEYPKVLLGSIDKEFMSLPKEVMIIALKHHQKYLMLEDAKGNLAPHFIIVSNINPEDGGAEVIKGNERVLRARLSDAQFFYEADKKQTLESRVSYLEKLTFHEKIGSVFDKMQSVMKLAPRVSAYFKASEKSVSRAIKLSKADLVTNMVKEFPELQGVMGFYYAQNDNESSDIALAIKEHYKPQGPSDLIPTGAISKATAVCDKLDTLNKMFEINIKPTGSKDPFALRRAANGVIRIVGEDKISEFLNELSTAKSLRDDVKEFILERNIK